MTRVLASMLLVGGLSYGLAQQKAPEPPEEDEIQAPKEYVFNPLQAAKEVKIGSYYYKKGKYTAAANRFTEATRWNPGLAEAYLRLGEAKAKLNDQKAADVAYQKYLELAPNSKEAAGLRKRLSSGESK